MYKYDEEKRKIIVDQPEKCTYCDECTLKATEMDVPGAISVRPTMVSTTGQYFLLLYLVDN